MTVKELIQELKKYPKDTTVCSGIKTSKCRWHFDLSIKESYPIDVRKSEDALLLWIGMETDEYTLVSN